MWQNLCRDLNCLKIKTKQNELNNGIAWKMEKSYSLPIGGTLSLHGIYVACHKPIVHVHRAWVINWWNMLHLSLIHNCKKKSKNEHTQKKICDLPVRNAIYSGRNNLMTFLWSMLKPFFFTHTQLLQHFFLDGFYLNSDHHHIYLFAAKKPLPVFLCSCCFSHSVFAYFVFFFYFHAKPMVEYLSIGRS